MTKMILVFTLVSAFAGLTASTSAVAREGGDGGECRIDCEDDPYYSNVVRGQLHNDEKPFPKKKKVCDLEQDFLVNGQCFDGRL